MTTTSDPHQPILPYAPSTPHRTCAILNAMWSDRVRATRRKCWYIAQRVMKHLIASGRPAQYVEGEAFMDTDYPVWHGWVEVDGVRIDPTPEWHAGTAHYFPAITAGAGVIPARVPISRNGRDGGTHVAALALYAHAEAEALCYQARDAHTREQQTAYAAAHTTWEHAGLWPRPSARAASPSTTAIHPAAA